MIDPALLDFLKDLAQNNNKPWFEERKDYFKKLDSNFKDFTTSIYVDLNKNDTIEKVKNYRIYRDVRFSKDKTPFKAHRSANWLRAGKNRRGSYYMRIKPNENLIGIGFFAPEKEDLLRIRKELELDAQEMRGIISSPSFISSWGSLQGEQLKTAPRNFDKNHPDIDLIRFKAFYFMKSYTDKEVISPNFMSQILDSFNQGRTFLDYMTSVLTTDLNGESLL
ncbi:DUF2461 domain-containing protein [uncultured Nonlabens sp.]|uniref:DUF2461 domain-containing protein n=1 Tax=uncultured Nonlabens sp. TaxID=859306 RepID=UPI002603973F|nr:DUF2461 domain-containing protein [uncultured Nonlabens sp.]